MPDLLLIGAPERTARFPLRATTPDALGEAPPRVDGVALLLEPGESPHALGYRLFLAGVPIRVGRSAEFGGLSLSTRLPPDADDSALVDALVAETRA